MKESSDLQLSIIIPVYQVEKYVRPCLESVFNQGLDDEDFEVIIVNDGTKDRSMEVIQDIIDQHKNITVINQENQGLSMARNNGMAIAKGEYILMPDSDDLLIADGLKPLLEIATKTKVDLVIADFTRMNDDEIGNSPMPKNHLSLQIKEMSGHKLYIDEFSHATCSIWHTLFRKDFIRKNNVTFIPGIYFEDIPFTTECYLKAEKCLRAYWMLNVYRIRESSITDVKSFNMKQAKDFTTSIAKTWELRKMEGLSSLMEEQIKKKLYVTYSSLLFRILYKTEKSSDQLKMIKHLKENTSDLIYSDTYIQRIGNWLYKLSPRLYIIAQKWAWKSKH